MSHPENPYFRLYSSILSRQSYQPPVHSTFMAKYIPGERARAELVDIERLRGRNNLTALADGWDDRLRRSVYGFCLSEVNESPVIIELQDFTGARNTADNVRVALDEQVRKKGVDWRSVVACCTDNPTTMIKMCRDLSAKYPWVIVCILLSTSLIIADSVIARACTASCMR